MSRTPKGLPEQLAIVLTYQCKLILKSFKSILIQTIEVGLDHEEKDTLTSLFPKDAKQRCAPFTAKAIEGVHFRFDYSTAK